MAKLFRVFLVVFVAFIIVSCGGGDGDDGAVPPPSTPESRGGLVSATVLNTYTTTQINGLFAGSIFAGLTASYAVTTYKIVYKTVDPAGNLIDASGLLGVPHKTVGARSPILSLQHGTIFLNNEAPSLSIYQNTVSAMLGSLGFVVAMPDYVGYGTSSGRIHPYVHAATLASATIDLLRAVRTYLANNAILVNGQVFLAGYSEGGYATLAAHKVMQESLSAEFTVTASVPAAGPYDLTQSANIVLSAPTLASSPYVAFLFKAYDTIYGWNRISEIFQAPYVNAVNTSFDGTVDDATIAASLTSVTTDLFNATFLTNFLDNGEATVKADLAQNDIYDWTPNAPVRLFHGVDDVTVPYANAIMAEATMQANGAADVLLIPCAGVVPTNHENCFDPFAFYALSFIATLATDL